MKRIVGVWTTGIGAANYFGMIALYSLPFGLFWLREAKRKRVRAFVTLYLVMTACTIIFSGTRGAMLGFLFFVLINMKTAKQWRVGIAVLVLSGCLFTTMAPQYLQDRFLSTFSALSGKEVEEYSIDELEQDSALGRWEGLVDGWKLAKQRPIFGYGPGSSPHARKRVNKELREEAESVLQLHSLYGQALAETGFLGTFLFFLSILVYLRTLKRVKRENRPVLQSYIWTLQSAMWVLLFYGFISHTLYRYYWFVLFACHGGLMDIVARGQDEDREPESVNMG
jgi:O-antigen ligase